MPALFVGAMAPTHALAIVKAFLARVTVDPTLPNKNLLSGKCARSTIIVAIIVKVLFFFVRSSCNVFSAITALQNEPE